MCAPSRRQLLLAGAALPLLPRLPRAVPTVAFGGLDVQPRAAWGADLKPKGPLSEEVAADVRFLLVHHTASSNAYATGDVAGLLRGFYGFHTTAKGWADIAYNFLVDRFGQVWEGRTGSLSGPVKGDATGGSQGFDQLACFIGDHTTQPPTAAALEAMGKLLGALAGRYKIDVRPGTKITFTSRGSNLHPAGQQVTTPTIAGHRDMSKTTCPGDACYPLIVSRLVPAAVAVAAAGAVGPAAPVPAVAPGPTPTSAPEATPATAPIDTLPAANPGGAPLDTVAATPSSVPPTLGGGAANRARGGGRGVVAAAAAGGAVAAAGLVALVLRRRGNARESGHWQQARRLDETHEDGGRPQADP